MVEDRPEPRGAAGVGGRAGGVGLAVRHRQPPVRRPHRHPVPPRARPRLRRPGGERGRRASTTASSARRWRSSRRCRARTARSATRASSLDCQKKKLMGLWSDGCMTEKVAVPRVNLDPAARGRRGVAGVAAGADRGGPQHRRPAADRARRDGDGARAGPDRAGAHPAVRALGGGPADRHRRAREEPFAVAKAYGATHCINVTKTDVRRPSPTSPNAARAPTS